MVGETDPTRMEGTDGNATRQFLRSLSTADWNALQSLAQPWEIASTNAIVGSRILWVDTRTYRDMAHRDRVRRVLLDRGREQGREELVQGLLTVADEVAWERTTRLLSEESDWCERVGCDGRCRDCPKETEAGHDGRDCGCMDW